MLEHFIPIALLIVLSPTFLFFDGPVGKGCLVALSAALIAVNAFLFQPADGVRFHRELKIAVLCSLIPSLWMLAQTLPLGISGVSHPVWESASAALRTSLWASISVDRGSTLVATGYYTAFVALGLSAAITAFDRRSAELILFALLAACVAVAAIQSFLPAGLVKSNTISTVASIGSLIAAVYIIRVYERSESRSQDSPGKIFAKAGKNLAIGFICFGVCFAALMQKSATYMIIASWGGLALLAAFILVRRLGFGTWGLVGVFIALTGILFTVMLRAGTIHTANFLFLVPPETAGIETASRVSADAKWLGAGAGNFSEIENLYLTLGDASVSPPRTTAAVFAVELGKLPFLLAAICIGLFIAYLSLATIQRGRDSFYPALGAAVLLVLSIAAFGDTSLLHPTVAILTAAIVGLAVAQSRGSSKR